MAEVYDDVGEAVFEVLLRKDSASIDELVGFVRSEGFNGERNVGLKIQNELFHLEKGQLAKMVEGWQFLYDCVFERSIQESYDLQSASQIAFYAIPYRHC